MLGDLLDVHWLATSVIASATTAVSGQPGKADTHHADLLALSASFIQGIDICETTISEGLYVCATALLKQEMETLAAIHEVKNKRRKSGLTPNVKSLGKLAVLYGDLNGIAHVGDTKSMQRLLRVELSEHQSGAPLFPIFNSKLAKTLYGLHVTLLTAVAMEVGFILEELYGEGLKDFEIAMLSRAVKILKNEGWVGVDTTTSSV